MRPIKFRKWNTLKKVMDNDPTWEWVEGVKINWGFEHAQNSINIYMQFTGLLDKNGKGIYEGDIVLFERNRDGFAELQWRKEIKFETDMYNAKFDFPCFDSCEVIGNIYENPDLLSK